MINCNITMIKLLTWCSGMGSYLACKIYIFNIFVRIPIYIYICSRQIFFSALHVVSHIPHSTYRFRFFTELYYFTWSLLSVQNLFSLPLLLSCGFFLNSSFPYASSYCFCLCQQDSHCQGRWESGQWWETKWPAWAIFPVMLAAS